MSAPISILVIGLDFDWTATNHSDKFDVEKIGARVIQDIKALHSVPGLEVDLLLLNPDKNGLDEATNKLSARHGGKLWSAVIIGFGLRGLGELTPLFESVVNLAKDVSPQVRLLFTGPGADVVETVQRNFPQLQMAS